MRVTPSCRWPFLVACAVLLNPTAVRAESLTWQVQGANPAEWNTTVNNWLPGPQTYTDGGVDDVTFRYNSGSPIFIGTGALAQDVTPITTYFYDSTGTWNLTGGVIKGTGAVRGGWDVTANFTSATSYEFSGGADPYGGWFSYTPTVFGTFHFGTGAITLGGRRGGGYDRFAFTPAVAAAGSTLTNDFIVTSRGATMYAPTNGGILSGTFNLDGTLNVASSGWTFTAPVSIASGDRTVTLASSQNLNSKFRSAVSGGNVLTLAPGGNTTAWTDYYWFVDTAATWTISAFTKDGTGNLSFLNPRALGNTVNLRTGAVIMGGSASDEDWLPNAAPLNFVGGKLFLRGDSTGAAKTETVGAINISSAYSELRINTLSPGFTHTLQSTGGLTRANDATALVAMGTNTQIVLPSAPTLYGGGGGAGSQTISIVPWLAGSTSTTESDRYIGGDGGSTFITFDGGTGSLRPLNTTTEFAAAIAGAGATTNVRKAAASETLAANASINALVFSATGAARTIDGAYTLQVNSGSVLTYSDAWANSATISTSQLDFNGQEANIFVTGNGYAQVRTIIASDITNAAKVIKSGFGALYLTGNSTFTGPLIQNSGGLSGNNAEGVIVRGTLATTDVRIMRDNLVLEGGDNRLNPSTVLMVNAGASLRVNRQLAGDPTTINQTLRGIVSGPDGGGSVGGGVYNFGGGYSVGAPTFNLTINTSDAGDVFTYGGSINANLVKTGPGTQVVGGGVGVYNATTTELREGAIRSTSGSRGGLFLFNGGYWEGASFRDWSYGTTMDNKVNAIGDMGFSAYTSNMTVWISGGTAQEWGVSTGFLPNGARLMFNRPTSQAVAQYDSPINLGSTAGTPQLREFYVQDNPAVSTDYGAMQGVISGAANDKTLLKTGDGTLVLLQNNSYAGPTRIDAGTLRLNAANSLPGGINATGGTSHLILNGGVLGLGNGNFLRGLGTGNTQVEWTGSGGFAAYGADRNVNLGNAAATVQWNAGSFVPAGSALILGAGDATHMLTFQNPIDLNGGQRTVQADNGAAAVDGRITGLISNSTGTGGLTKTGLGTLELTAANSYNGPTLIQGGTLKLGTGGSLASTSAVIVGGGATFDASAVGGWQPGAGQTLGGNGTVIGNVTATGTGVGTRSIIAPGESIGTLTVMGNVTLGDFSTLAIELGSDGVSDQLIVNGNLNLASGSDRLDLDLLPANWLVGSYTLATWTGALTGLFSEVYYEGAAVAPGAYINGNYWLEYGSNSLTLVPEPGMLLGLGLGAALLLRRRRG